MCECMPVSVQCQVPCSGHTCVSGLVLGWLLSEMDVDSIKYSKILAGIFQTVISDSKKQWPVIEDFMEKSQKLEVQLKTTILVFTSFNESLLKVAATKENSRKGRHQT